EGLAELALGGTAVGTGLNSHPDFPRLAIAEMVKETGLPFREAPDRFEALGARDACVHASGVLRTIAVSLTRIAHDVRQLGSGPRCGIAELKLPAVAPGSSIMPGKVNPVMSEALIQASAWVIGNDVACALGGVGGLGSNYELNTMKPLFAFNLLESIRVLAGAVRAFTEKCVRGIEVDRERATELVERSLMNVTKLAPVVGYDEAARIAKDAYKTGRSLKQVVLSEGLLPEQQLDELLDPTHMLGPSS
ncbi:MAG: aspartate ammonia-lyase, partial [Planctomycetes bacterium]|nr:aspartate ammonia-lyase [Planctomycetota bacterium]